MGVTNDLAFPNVGPVFQPAGSPEAQVREADRIWESFVLLQASLREAFAHILHTCHLRLLSWVEPDNARPIEWDAGIVDV